MNKRRPIWDVERERERGDKSQRERRGRGHVIRWQKERIIKERKKRFSFFFFSAENFRCASHRLSKLLPTLLGSSLSSSSCWEEEEEKSRGGGWEMWTGTHSVVVLSGPVRPLSTNKRCTQKVSNFPPPSLRPFFFSFPLSSILRLAYVCVSSYLFWLWIIQIYNKHTAAPGFFFLSFLVSEFKMNGGVARYQDKNFLMSNNNWRWW